MKWRTLSALVLAVLLVAMPAMAEPRDGVHDFDAEIGRWRIETQRLMHPLANANDWTRYEGEKVVAPIWGGRGNFAEVRESGEAGQLHFIALRLYDPQARQWSLHFTSANDGAFGTPLHGELRDGAMEFVGPDTFHGRTILVRFLTRVIDGDHARSEQYFSADGGRTWELNWINEYTRLEDAPAVAAPATDQTSEASARDFDFTLGTFYTSIRRLEHPLSGSNNWVSYEGAKTDVAILGGAGSVEQIDAQGAGHLELMTLRLYDAEARQWSLNFSTAATGQLAPPAIGSFANGVGTFLSQEEYDGRTILVRQIWSGASPTSYHFEQAFSADFGATWETNFVANLRRVGTP